MAENTQETTQFGVEDLSPSAMATTVVIPSPEAHVSILDDRAILLNLDSGAYHALNAVGTFIWELFTPNRTLANIHSAICERYEVIEDTAREDLLELVTRLNNAGLVHLENKVSASREEK